jgi:hypothetical protein
VSVCVFWEWAGGKRHSTVCDAVYRNLGTPVVEPSSQHQSTCLSLAKGKSMNLAGTHKLTRIISVRGVIAWGIIFIGIALAAGHLVQSHMIHNRAYMLLLLCYHTLYEIVNGFCRFHHHRHRQHRQHPPTSMYSTNEYERKNIGKG